MKKITALMLAMALLLCGCGQEDENKEPNIGTIPSTSTVAFDPTPQEPEPEAIPDNEMTDALINNDRICVKIGEQWGFIDTEGNVVIQPLLNSPGKFNAGLLPVNDNGLYGYIDTDGEWAIQPQFLYAAPFSEGVATIAMLDATGSCPIYSLINHTGRTLTTFRADSGRGWPFKNGAAIVGWYNQQYAVVDQKGDMVFETQFDQFYGDESTYQFIFEGLIGVCVDGKWGFIDSAGEWIIEAQYEAVERFRDGLCTVKIDGQWGVIDTTGQVVVEPAYDWYVTFSDDLACVEIDGKYGYIDKTGKVAIQPKFDYAYDFADGVALARNDKGHYGLIDTTGNWVLEPCYMDATPFHYGLAAVTLDGTNWGYIDKTGEMVIAADYRSATPFYEDGYAAVMTQDGKWTVIDNTGARLFDATFDGVGNYAGIINEYGKTEISMLGR